jgi:hypothetical protein
VRGRPHAPAIHATLVVIKQFVTHLVVIKQFVTGPVVLERS